jgi:hypothetical protein
VLIDEYVPRWDVRSHHQIAVSASPESTYVAVRTADLGSHPLVRAMFALRALPSALTAGRVRELRARGSRVITLAEFERHGFQVVAERPPSDLLIGLEGAFWKPDGDLRPVSAATFREAVPRDLARGAWCFCVDRVSATESVLSTETRVLTGGNAARWRFRLYWVFVGWASGVIRHMMLRSIKAEAEHGNSSIPRRRSAHGT